MATLGRKSMKKTLKSLRREAFYEIEKAIQEWSKFRPEIDRLRKVNVALKKLVDEAQKGKTVDSKEATYELLEHIQNSLKSYILAFEILEGFVEAFQPLLTYVESLEYYTSELDEAWDKYGEAWESLSKKMKQAVEEIPHPKKEKKKKTRYID